MGIRTTTQAVGATTPVTRGRALVARRGTPLVIRGNA